MGGTGEQKEQERGPGSYTATPLSAHCARGAGGPVGAREGGEAAAAAATAEAGAIPAASEPYVRQQLAGRVR